MSEESIASAIRAALEVDRDINMHASTITIKVEDVIHLEGEVADIIAKRKALRIAHQHAGGLPIEDRLRLVSIERIIGDQLRDAALGALRREPAFAEIDIDTGTDAPSGQDRDWMRVTAVDCSIKVTGEVKSLSHRRFAEVLLWWLPGSCDVYNGLHVRPPQADHDEEITDVVRMVFDKEPALDAEQISVVTRDREVTLRGAVTSEAQKQIAARDVWYIPGVHAVHNELEMLSR